MPTLQIPSKLFAAVYDKLNEGPEQAGLRVLRQRLLAQASGPTLEIGAGTGLNLDHYPPAVTRLVLLEPDAAMRAKLTQKLATSGREAEIGDAPAERLPYADGEFETVVATMVLCTVADPAAALAEIRRVLAPGGGLVFAEHVLSEDARKARLQALARPVYYVMGRGCHPNRDTGAAIAAAGFRLDARRETAPKTPPTENELLVGVARR